MLFATEVEMCDESPNKAVEGGAAITRGFRQ
jgi:hypothetical protein